MTEGARRAVASVFVVAFAGVLAVLNLWYVPGARKLTPHTGPVKEAGLAQAWGMFVFRPDPPPVAQVLRATVTHADGTTRGVGLPQDARFLGAQRAARWSKLGEFARPMSHGEGDGTGQELWRPLCAWLVRTESAPGNPVVAAALVSRERDIPPLGSHADPPWRDTVAFACPVP